jgi:hypothetical protein
MHMSRQRDLDLFYELLAELADRSGGSRTIEECSGRLPWPSHGVYFILEEGELRADNRTPRVVRVGTHGLKAGSTTTLWGRLAQHRGTRPPGRAGGAHRGSVFRQHVGRALIARGHHPEASASWGKSTREAKARRPHEAALEALVSHTIGAMRVLVIPIEDESGPASARAIVEANTIALLSNFHRPALDPPSGRWLGHHAAAEKVRRSGLWNVNHVTDEHDPVYLQLLGRAVQCTPLGG